MSWIVLRTGMLALCAGALAFISQASADYKAELIKPGVIVVGTTGTAPPFTMTDASGKLAGYDIDIMNRVAADLGLKAEFVQLEFAGLLPGLGAGRFDVVASGVVRTPQRLASKDFTLLSPYTVNGVAIVRRKGDTQVTGWKDVCGKRMGAVRGAVQPKIALEKLPQGCVSDVREYPGWTEMILDLKNRRVDFVVGDFLGPSYLTKADGQVEVIPDVIETNSQSIAVNAKSTELAARIDELLKRYRADGTIDSLLLQHFGAKLDWALLDAAPAK
jgi:ABC-type amino acid transport substrate-binding protein